MNYNRHIEEVAIHVVESSLFCCLQQHIRHMMPLSSISPCHVFFRSLIVAPWGQESIDFRSVPRHYRHTYFCFPGRDGPLRRLPRSSSIYLIRRKRSSHGKDGPRFISLPMNTKEKPCPCIGVLLPDDGFIEKYRVIIFGWLTARTE